MIDAQKRDAINRNKFWFRNNIFTDETPEEVREAFVVDNRLPYHQNQNRVNGFKQKDDECCLLMTIDQIINGKERRFPGLVPLIRQYVKSVETDVQTQQIIDNYLELISGRASGRLRTCAKWIRDFVRQHNDYKSDSIVSNLVNYDLLMSVKRLQNETNNQNVINSYE